VGDHRAQNLIVAERRGSNVDPTEVSVKFCALV